MSKAAQKAALTSPCAPIGIFARTLRARWIRHLWRSEAAKADSAALISSPAPSEMTSNGAQAAGAQLGQEVRPCVGSMGHSDDVLGEIRGQTDAHIAGAEGRS